MTRREVFEKQQQLHLEKAFDVYELANCGDEGAWYILLVDIEEVYSDRIPDECAGLKELNMKVDPNDVGEYFCDLVCTGYGVERVKLKFTLFNN